ncbi:MAG: IS110 family transposase [Chloroflexota bacterium]|nr:IS110 family transposase [Chloroflexota bacterium]
MSKPPVLNVPVVNAEALGPPVSENTATALRYLGLDVGQRQVSACLLLADGREAIRRWSVPNTRPGAEALVGRSERVIVDTSSGQSSPAYLEGQADVSQKRPQSANEPRNGNGHRLEG